MHAFLCFNCLMIAYSALGISQAIYQVISYLISKNNYKLFKTSEQITQIDIYLTKGLRIIHANSYDKFGIRIQLFGLVKFHFIIKCHHRDIVGGSKSESQIEADRNLNRMSSLALIYLIKPDKQLLWVESIRDRAL